MRQAYTTAQRGSCLRLRVGALIVRDRDKRVISGGYNGAPRGMPDCLEVGCDLRPNLNGRDSCFRTLHAESNALDLCGPLSEPHTMYVTVTPCRNCAMRMIQHGITRCMYHKYYESQGTSEVEAIFAANDTDTISLLLERYGEGALPKPRVIFEQLNASDVDVGAPMASTAAVVASMATPPTIGQRADHAYLSAGDNPHASGDRAYRGCSLCGRSRAEHPS